MKRAVILPPEYYNSFFFWMILILTYLTGICMLYGRVKNSTLFYVLAVYFAVSLILVIAVPYSVYVLLYLSAFFFVIASIIFKMINDLKVKNKKIAIHLTGINLVHAGFIFVVLGAILSTSFATVHTFHYSLDEKGVYKEDNGLGVRFIDYDVELKSLTDKGVVDQIIDDTRSLIFDICPIHLYQLGLEKALELLVEKIQEQHGIKTLLKKNGNTDPLDDDVRVLLYRTVRELLINIVKHARAQNAKVSIQRDRKNIKIKIEDDGIGFDTTKIQCHVDKQSGFGLFSLQERLNYLGGQIEFKSKHRHGTSVSLVVPLNGNGKTRGEEVICV